jgi:hypothetical protein
MDTLFTYNLHCVVSSTRSLLSDIIITGIEPFPRPAWATFFNARLSPWSEFENRSRLPAVAIIRTHLTDALLCDRWIHQIVEKQRQTPSYSVIASRVCRSRVHVGGR